MRALWSRVASIRGMYCRCTVPVATSKGFKLKPDIWKKMYWFILYRDKFVEMRFHRGGTMTKIQSGRRKWAK